MSAIYLIRHGQASFGGQNYDELSPTGRTQAALLGDFLQAAGLRFDAVYAGDMRRQQDTATIAISLADPASPTPRVRQHPAFNEFDHERLIRNHWKAVSDQTPASGHNQTGVTEADAAKRFQRVFAQIMSRWVSGRYPIPGEETWDAFVARVNRGLSEVTAPLGPSDAIAIFTSGGPIAAILKELLQLSSETAITCNWQIANCSITKLNYNGRNTSLAFFNSYAHLQLNANDSWVTYR